ncbi:hypothetical protein RZ882_018835 [Clostridioides difficile]|uniref:hypothetical protein n=3 Tax=Clostridioides difficile TaxID=1496 RepID=UPI0008A5295D|nr:hypothetical protein [Clostridioides difficile]OFU34414.1 hypothetical protein HMPREF3075_03995 [Clostridium sp. HMSC19B11]EGT3847226.1 hypothetical protein [Clostridioides difficile]EGT4699154.1 hypothetical protein [Clostridioides difficile]EGT4917757.1 hypothetical protein [Clostridioides difficile]MBH7453497.1 hypothetical protein [Clostridioides difficile]
MNKDKFNELDISKQIEYINNQLENNETLTYICKNIGIGRSTIRDRFKKANYSYSKDLNKYIHECITDVLQEPNIKNNRCITTDIQKEKNNISDTNVIQSDAVREVINKSDKEIKDNLLDIVSNYDVLKEIIELHKCNTSVIKQQIVIDLEDSDSKLTTLRVNSKELELFNKFCDNNKQFKKIDLISQALKEFREKYN